MKFENHILELWMTSRLWINDVAPGIDIIFLVETWNMETGIYLILMAT